MIVTNIKISQKRSLGNYENIEFMAEGVIEEGESVKEATERLWGYVDWYAQKTNREGKAHTFRLALADENTTPEKKAQAQKWLDQYEARRIEIEAM
jgi:hypothetical protein